VRILIVSISSDIGHALAVHWMARGWSIAGTYRTASEATAALARQGVPLVPCDLDRPESVKAACSELARSGPWDALVICPATLEPIGLFADCDFDEWARSFGRNFIEQMRVIRELLPARNLQNALGPCVICWAGGGVNSAPASVSAYTVSKIAQIKMVELLDAEVPDTRFVIVGPGWVRTKIHEATIRAGERAGAVYRNTSARLADAGSGWTDISRVIASCDWMVSAERAVISGRNFSVASDAWGTPELNAELLANPDMYKLRRNRNDWPLRAPDCDDPIRENIG
jgi:NAD(P)-dependent dehydrogenase (short-subunit alcohol dehydrogenase family)